MPRVTIVEDGESVGYIDTSDDGDDVVYNGKHGFLNLLVDDINDGIRLGSSPNDLGGPDEFLSGEKIIEKFELIRDNQPDVDFELVER